MREGTCRPEGAGFTMLTAAERFGRILLGQTRTGDGDLGHVQSHVVNFLLFSVAAGPGRIDVMVY